MNTVMNQSKEHFLSIKLDNELFAVSVYKVLEVLQKQHITRVPNVPDFIKGVINFRGEILPVIEARQKFNMPERENQSKHVIIVLDLELNNKQIMLGFIADAVSDVFEVANNDIKDVPEMGNNYNTDFIQGMIKMDNRFLMLLDVDRIFSTSEMDFIKNNDL